MGFSLVSGLFHCDWNVNCAIRKSVRNRILFIIISSRDRETLSKAELICSNCSRMVFVYRLSLFSLFWSWFEFIKGSFGFVIASYVLLQPEGVARKRLFPYLLRTNVSFCNWMCLSSAFDFSLRHWQLQMLAYNEKMSVEFAICSSLWCMKRNCWW